MQDAQPQASVIARFEGPGIIDYGAPEVTKLTVIAVDANGSCRTIIFEQLALRQLARLMNDIGTDIPGAIRGH